MTNQASREKVVLATGNVEGVAEVDDQLMIDQAGTLGRFYTVLSGDTLSRIARQHYGNANEYRKIFEESKPMLSHPDKMYPGQVVRIPWTSERCGRGARQEMILSGPCFLALPSNNTAFRIRAKWPA